MAKIVFHIGTHKTGTTALQNQLFRNRKLLERQGVIYPEVGIGPSHSGHHELAWAAAGQSHRLKKSNASAIFEKARFAIETAGDQTVVFSSEEFGNLSPKLIEKMGAELGIESANIVVYFRNQIDYLIAQYKQHIKQFETRYTGTLLDYIVEFNILNRMSYAALVSGWANIFGKESINIRVYDRADLVKGDIVEDFCQVIELDSGVLKNDTKDNSSDNKSISDFAAEVLRYANRLDMSAVSHQNLIEDISSASREYQNYTFLDPASSLRIWRKFNEVNLRLKEHFDVNIDSLNKSPNLDGKVTIAQCDDPVIKVFSSIFSEKIGAAPGIL